MAKRPSHVPTFEPSSYGDGGFFFTQPVGAGGGYSDGGFFFTQPVGAGGGYSGANRTVRRRTGFVHPAYAGTHAYGAAPKLAAVGVKATSTGKPTGRSTGSSATGTGIDSAPDTKRAAATASAATIKAFEDAAYAHGKTKFWAEFWQKAKAALGTKYFSTASTREKTSADAAHAATEKTLRATREALLLGVPPFPVKETGAAAGTSTGPTYSALRAYEQSFIDKGYYAEAYRNVSKGKRKYAKSVMDLVVSSLVPPLANASWNKSNAKVWTQKKPDLKPYTAMARACLLADVQSDFTPGIAAWKGFGTWVVEEVGVSKYAIRVGSETFDRDYYEDIDRKRVTLMNASVALQEALFTKAFNDSVTSLRKEQDTKLSALVGRLDATKKAWETARKTFVETARTAERLTIEQQNNALTAKNKAAQAESAFDKTRDFAAAALSARQGAEGAALVANVTSTQQYATAADAAAKGARTKSDEALRLAQEVTSLAARAGGLAANDKERADAASVSAERSAGEARESADAAAAQVAIAQAALSVKLAEEAANAAAANVVQADAAAVDAVATAQGAQAAADAAKGAADRAAVGVANGTVSAAVAEAALREYERLQAIATAASGMANAEQQKAANIKAEADRIEGLAAAERDKKDEITKDVFTPGEQEVERLKKVVRGDMAPVAQESFFAKYKTPILATALVGGAAFAYYYLRVRTR